jgi:hypothetical protein
MAPTQSSLGGGSNLNRSNQPNGAPYGGAAASSEESFTLNNDEEHVQDESVFTVYRRRQSQPNPLHDDALNDCQTA